MSVQSAKTFFNEEIYYLGIFYMLALMFQRTWHNLENNSMNSSEDSFLNVNTAEKSFRPSKKKKK